MIKNFNQELVEKELEEVKGDKSSPRELAPGLSHTFFYFDKEFYDEVSKKLKELKKENNLKYNDVAIGRTTKAAYKGDEGTVWLIAYKFLDQGNTMIKAIRSFDWGSIGVTGFHETVGNHL